MSSLRDDLSRALGPDHVIAEGDDLAFYGADRCRGDWPVAPGLIVLPATIEEVQAVVRICAAHGVPIVPSGGRTGLTGAATATHGEVVLSLTRMSRILEVDPAARLLRCEAGATVEAAHLAAAEHGLLYPVDFAAKGSAHVGGSIATNAGGVKVLRYGLTRQWVQGLKVVVASGECLSLGGALVKDNTGYDLRQLFIGAEGTLGIVVEATLRLCAPPAGRVVALCAVPDEERVLELFARVQASGLVLQAFECFDAGCLRRVLEHRGRDGAGPFDPPSPQHALLEVEVPQPGPQAHEATTDALAEQLADAQDVGTITDAVLASTEAQARELWALREDTSESLHRHRPHKSDVSVPVAALPRFLAAWRQRVAAELPGVEAVVFGHIGDGNLHLNLLQPADEDPTSFQARCKAFDARSYALVHDFHGSVSAEHGIGLLKRDHLHFSRSPTELQMMRAIKHALDPQGLFNPGKMLPDPQ
ncbi:MAG: FAD-binding oxidoreductase [Myxococcales bacterium]|nr:FAD-binding oxidoreductase [Myxococcales bacterium]